MDRRQAMVEGRDLPERTSGAALFADISGFTPQTETLVKELGPRRGAEELTRQLNVIYRALITKVHYYRGSVIGFSGDAITCWFDDDPSARFRQAQPGGSGQAGLRATACAFRMQQALSQFVKMETPHGKPISLKIKTAIAAGPVRRFLVGNPQIQTIDVLAGTTLDCMAEAERWAKQGEIVVGPEAMSQMGGQVEILKWRENVETGRRFAVVAGLRCQVKVTSWPSLSPSAEGAAVEAMLRPEPLTEEQIRPWLLPPIYERLRTGQGQFLAELRPAVAFFLKFGGLDYDQDDAAGEKLDTYIRWVQNILSRHEGFLIQLTTGDKGNYLYAVFGAPLAHDDDPARAVGVAIDLLSPPPKMDFITAVQIGISQGRMRTGAYGSPTRRTYGVLGDEANVAARLMGNAEPGQVLVSKRVADAAGKGYRFEYLDSVKLKGKKEPLPVYTPSGRQLSSSQRPANAFKYPLVGRDDEMAQMERVLASVLAGEGQVLRLEGDAGIGKSHLAAEFVERALDRGLQIASGACHSTSRATTYAPWRQVFRTLFGLADEPTSESAEEVTSRQKAQVKAIVANMNSDWLPRLPLLGDLLDLTFEDGESETTKAFDLKLRKEALFALIVEIVKAWAGDQPLLLLIEDAHWMDEASLELTMALGRTLAHLPVLLTLVHRPLAGEEQPLLSDLDRLPYHHLVKPDKLSLQAIRMLVTNRLKGEPSTLALSLLQAVAQGNPFFTEELVDALRESGGLCQDGEKGDGAWVLSELMFDSLRGTNCLTKENGQWVLSQDAQLSAADLGIPDSVHGIVLSRIDRLAELHKLTLKVAGVIGRTFEFDVLEGSHPARPGQKALLKQIEVLQTRDFIQSGMPLPQSSYAFKHNITQEVVYRTLLEDQQRELHRAVGEALETLLPRAIERLAYHYSRSSVRDKALEYLDRAADKAQLKYANETALNYYNQALALEERWKWLKGKVDILHTICGRDELGRDEEYAALQDLEAAPNAPVSEVTFRWGRYYEAVKMLPRAQAKTKRALVAYRDLSDVTGEVHCLIQLGLIARRQGDYNEAMNQYNQAWELLKSIDEHFDEKAKVLNGLGTVCREQGYYDEAREYGKRSLDLSHANGNLPVEAEALTHLGIIAADQRSFSEAESYHRQALKIQQYIGARSGEAKSLANIAQALVGVGNYERANEYLSKALVIQRAVGDPVEEANIMNDFGLNCLELGDFLKARAHFEQGLRLYQEIKERKGEAYILGGLVQVVRTLGDLNEAQRLLERGMALAKELGDRYLLSSFYTHLGINSLLVGRLDQAIDVASIALDMLQELDMRPLSADNLVTLAEAHRVSGNVANALVYARQALSILEECGSEGPEFPCRDYFLCYRVLSVGGHEQDAHAALQSAYDLVMSQVEKISDPTLRQTFLEIPVNREIVQEYAEREL